MAAICASVERAVKRVRDRVVRSVLRWLKRAVMVPEEDAEGGDGLGAGSGTVMGLGLGSAGSGAATGR